MKVRRRRGLGGGYQAPKAGGTRSTPRDGAGPGPRARLRRWALPFGVILIAFAGGYLVAARWLFPAPGRPDGGSLVRIPELVGLTEAEARSRVEGLGLEYSVRSEIAHPRAPAGAVLAQAPLPGQLARPGAPVNVTLSRGAERHLLPDVAGLTERQARIVLERLGYVTRVTRVQDAMQRDRAVRTRPPAGVELPVPSEVELVISAGPPVASVPDLAGRHIDDVPQILADLGLELGAVSYDPAALEAPGRIIGQYPPAGYRLLEGGAVEVRVAGRPEDRDASPPVPGAAAPI